MPLKLSALWVRKCVLSRSLAKLTHLGLAESLLGMVGGWAGTGSSRKDRVQQQSQGPSL